MKTEINVYGETFKIELEVGKYVEGNRTAIVAVLENGEPWGYVTLNCPDHPLRNGEVVVKDYSENAFWVPQLLNKLPDIFQDTGKKVSVGYTQASIWRAKL